MPDLPTGTVTFLFTDIEGSTTRWEQHREAMQAALARHDAILRQAIEGHGGVVFKTVGDAFYAVFATAPDALAAALDAQRVLQTEAWDDQLGAVRVRMALHTGAAEQREGDYFGPPLNRVARLLNAGHGGQILLSGVAQGLVREALPPGVEWRDLGEHRLKDLTSPEHIFQVVAPALPADFPLLKTLDLRPHNLPVQRSPLIGRERELATVETLLRRDDVGLVTLVGPGGVGKTSLSLQVAATLLDDFPDGVWFVDLAPVSDPALVLATIAQTLGVQEAVGQPLATSLTAYLAQKHLLLCLDNFEQVVAAAPVVAQLLRTVPRVKILVTSRVVLGLYGEYHFPVPPLALPDPQQLPPLDRLSQYAAVRLFITRAQAAQADFQVTNENAPAVAEICARLDGLPLAIELAAARIRLLPPSALLARLDHRLQVLTGGARERTSRQQTLRGAIDWSYNLLEPAEQTLFTRLGVFVGGCTLEAVEAVCTAAGDLELDVLDGVASLVDKSLVQHVEGAEDEPRFRMLETIHEYASERLGAHGDAEVVRRRHAAYFLALAEHGALALQGEGQITWLDRLMQERGNLYTALDWTHEHGEVELAGRLAVALWRFWDIRGPLSEGRRKIEAVIADKGQISSSLLMKLYYVAGTFSLLQGDVPSGTRHLEASMALAQELNDPGYMAWSFNDLGTAALAQGDYAQAIMFFERSMTLKRQIGGATWDIAISLCNLGYAALLGGEFNRATAWLDEGLALAREAKDASLMATALLNLAHAALWQGDHERAAPLYGEALARWREVADEINIAECLEGLAGVNAVRRQAVRAGRLMGAVEMIRKVNKTALFPGHQARCEDFVSAGQAEIGEMAFATAWAEGQAMTLEQAIAYALSDES